MSSKGPNGEVICILPIFGVVFRSKYGYCTPGWPYIVLPPAVWQFTLSQIYIHGYFILPKGPNWEVICILPIFGVIFSQTWGTWPPGVTLYSANTCCWAIYFEEMLSYFVPNILWLFYIITWSKLEVIYIIPTFKSFYWPQFGHLTPRGEPI